MLRSANFERFERFPTAAKYGQVSEQNLRKIKVSHSMFGPDSNSDIIFDSVSNFGWTQLPYYCTFINDFLRCSKYSLRY